MRHIWTKAQQTGWFLGGCKLAETDRIQYIGAVISDNPFHHVESRISACRRAFYALQCVGLRKRGTNPETRYAICGRRHSDLCLHTEYVQKSNRITKLLKAAIGLKSYCRNTPILKL